VNSIVVIVALAAAALTAAGAAVAVARVRMAADDRVADAVRSLAEGMHDTMRDLARAVDTTQAARGERFAGELAASLDLDVVAERTLEAVQALPGVEAALLEAAGPGGSNVAATAGMASEEAERTILRLPENGELRAVEVTYRYRRPDGEAAAPPVRSGVIVPVRTEGEPVGLLGAFSRSSGRQLSEAEIDEFERRALRAGPALDNARRYAETRALADLDALTSLHNRRYFHETLAREVSRATRYRRRLTLIVLDLDDFKEVNDRVGHLAGDAVLAEVAARMRSAARATDIPCRIGGDEFAIVLPEAGRDEAEQLANRIARSVRSQTVAEAGTVRVSAGIAELRTDEIATELFERADKALYRAKQLGKARTVAASDG
jgi:diguanylate cyclase (GGDEF)-like protein